MVGHHPGLGIAPAASGSDLVGVVTSGLQVPAIELEMEESAVAEWLKQDARSTFDLSAPPLLRVALLRTPDRCHLVITCHHLITDGWTGQLLMLELAGSWLRCSKVTGTRHVIVSSVIPGPS